MSSISGNSRSKYVQQLQVQSHEQKMERINLEKQESRTRFSTLRAPREIERNRRSAADEKVNLPDQKFSNASVIRLCRFTHDYLCKQKLEDFASLDFKTLKYHFKNLDLQRHFDKELYMYHNNNYEYDVNNQSSIENYGKLFDGCFDNIKNSDSVCDLLAQILNLCILRDQLKGLNELEHAALSVLNAILTTATKFLLGKKLSNISQETLNIAFRYLSEYQGLIEGQNNKWSNDHTKTTSNTIKENDISSSRNQKIYLTLLNFTETMVKLKYLDITGEYYFELPRKNNEVIMKSIQDIINILIESSIFKKNDCFVTDNFGLLRFSVSERNYQGYLEKMKDWLQKNCSGSKLANMAIELIEKRIEKQNAIGQYFNFDQYNMDMEELTDNFNCMKKEYNEKIFQNTE